MGVGMFANSEWYRQLQRETSADGQKQVQKERLADSQQAGGQGNANYNPGARGLTVMTKGLGGIQDQRQRSLAAPAPGKPSVVGGGAPAGVAGKTALGG